MRQGATVVSDGAEGLFVTGLESRDVEIVATAAGVTLFELSTQRASLEDALLELTHEDGDFRAATPPARTEPAMITTTVAGDVPVAAGPSPCGD